jgi:hypothetical protein
MAENVITQTIPPGATPILLSISGAGTLYTAATKRRLHIVSLVISSVSSATAGTPGFIITPENGAAAGTLPLVVGTAASGIFAVPTPAAANVVNSATLDPIDLPTVSNVTTSLGGATGAVVVFTLVGWEEATEK